MHVRVLSPILNIYSIKGFLKKLFSTSSCDLKHLLSLSSHFNRVVGTGILQPPTLLCHAAIFFLPLLGLKMSITLGLKI